MSPPPAQAGSSALSPAEREAFRIRTPAEILSYLHALLDQQTRVFVSNPEGLELRTHLCLIDKERALIGLDLPPGFGLGDGLLDLEEIEAVAYLDAVKLQFELEQPVVIRDRDGSVLRAALPSRLYRFQRRQTFRVQPPGSTYPRVSLDWPGDEVQRVNLRVLDISIGGLALLLPPELPDLPPGQSLQTVQLELERDLRIELSLRLLHVSAAGGHPGGRHLGCAFESLEAAATRELQVFIDQTQKRRRLLHMR